MLRPLIVSDAADVAKLGGRLEIAATTLSIPRPFSEQQAHGWIVARAGGDDGKEVVFAITGKVDGPLIGTIGLCGIDTEHSEAEMGFWIGVDWWGQGYGHRSGGSGAGLCFH